MTAQDKDGVLEAFDYIAKSLATLVERIRVLDPDFVGSTHASSNAAYPLRAYAAFQRKPGGEELAVTINLKNMQGRVSLQADLCTEDGRVLLDLPSEVVHLCVPASNESSLEWRRSLDSFLTSVQPAILGWSG